VAAGTADEFIIVPRARCSHRRFRRVRFTALTRQTVIELGNNPA